MTRRAFALSAAAMYARGYAAGASTRPALCLFSKHLPNLNYADLARTVKQMGFDGVDLTVRAQGHVLPDRVAEDLPRAVAAIRAEGLAIPMITTGLISPADPAARPTLKTAGELKVPFFKLGYWHYIESAPVEARVAEVRRDVAGLVAIARESGITAGFHNHSGNYVGAAVWDTRAIIADLDPHSIGYYFDPCHATVEGGEGGWLIALGVALPRLKMVALKDFYWEKRDGKWRMEMCPMGKGMVNWPKFFSALAQARFLGPISLHVEYEPADMPAAIARDFAFVRKQLDSAYRGV